MAKPPPQKPAATPEEFPQVEPQELFPTNNIRFVMWETAKLTERIDALSKSVDGLSPAWEKALDKHAADIRERLADLKADTKETSAKISALKESIDSFKGAMKVFGGLYALALIIVAAFLAWYLRPIPQSAISSSAGGQSQQGAAPQSNVSVPAPSPKG